MSVRRILTAFRFTIRELLVVVAVAGVCAFAAKNSDPLAAAGIGIAAILAFFCFRLRKHRLARLARIVLAGAAIVVLWFAAVDRYCTIERCRHCDIHHFTFEYRVVGIPAWPTKHHEHGDLFANIARDLGRPCAHDYQRWPLVRRWGLVFPGRPAIGITCCLNNGADYETKMRPHILELAKSHPELADEFHQRVLKDKDYVFLRNLLASLPRS